MVSLVLYTFVFGQNTFYSLKHWHYLVLQYTDTLRIPSPADVAATTFLCNDSYHGLLVDIYINRDRRPEVCNSDMAAILSV